MEDDGQLSFGSGKFGLGKQQSNAKSDQLSLKLVSVIAPHEREIAEIKDLLNETRKEKERLQIELERVRAEKAALVLE